MHSAIAMRRLEAIPEISRSGGRLNGLFRLLTCRDLWVDAYGKIARNAGSSTPGADGQTFDGISLSRIDRLASQVLEGTYEPTPVRRVYIPKSNGKLRPLGIPSVQDRLVQEVVRRILEAVYEPIFSDHSHGFRSGRSCHTALEHIRDVWDGVKWFVEVDIVGYFDNIDHQTLMRLLEKKVDDKRFLRLVNSFLTAGYLEDWRYHGTFSGTPQGGIISPLLANIYLHELDQFMEDWIKRRNLGKGRKVNPAWDKITSRITYLNKKRKALLGGPLPGHLTDATTPDDRIAKIDEEISLLRTKQMTIPSKDPLDPGYRRYRYVRYADDFLIGVIGSKADAEEMMEAVRHFVAGLRLEVSPTKSAIRHASDGVIFLGYDIHTRSPHSRVRWFLNRWGTFSRKRAPSDRITLNVPYKKVEDFCIEKGYGELATMANRSRPTMLQSSAYEIVLQHNAEFRGFAEYYSMAGNVKRSLNRLEWMVRGCVLKTLAHKHRSSLPTVARQMRGPDGHLYATSTDLAGKQRRIRLWTLKELQRPSRGNASLDKVTFPRHTERNDAVHRMFSQECSNCGSSDRPIEIHHVRKLADHSKSPYMDYIKAARSRKRIPLCEYCHDDLHAGRLADYRSRKKGAMESRVH
jgi:RNA-directed DNA polymerase